MRLEPFKIFFKHAGNSLICFEVKLVRAHQISQDKKLPFQPSFASFMNHCTIRTKECGVAEGDAQFYDHSTNRFFVCYDGKYSWYNPEDIEFHCDIHSIAG